MLGKRVGLITEEDLEVEMMVDIVVEIVDCTAEGSLDIEGNKVVVWVDHLNRAPYACQSQEYPHVGCELIDVSKGIKLFSELHQFIIYLKNTIIKFRIARMQTPIIFMELMKFFYIHAMIGMRDRLVLHRRSNIKNGCIKNRLILIRIRIRLGHRDT